MECIDGTNVESLQEILKVSTGNNWQLPKLHNYRTECIIKVNSEENDWNKGL